MTATIDTTERTGVRDDRRYLEELEKRVLFFDGAMGTQIHAAELTAEDYGGVALEGCNENLVLLRPEVIERIHEAYLEAGADVIETDTFQGSRLKLDEWGLGDKTLEINRAAARIARRAADRWSTPERPRFVAGSIGPTGMLPSADDPALSKITYAELTDIFYEQARGLAEGGADLFIVETMVDILELRAAITGINRLNRDLGRRIPIQAQAFFDVGGRMLLGTDIEAVMTTLEALPGVDLIGLNCGTGPEHMREPIRFLTEHSRAKISVIPNAGIPINVADKAVFPLGPEDMARDLAEFVNDFGVSTVGGCCGTTPAHIAALVATIGERAPKERIIV
jgi:5-methyltetrahydrofolate--homocysteine methyltransferase